MNTKLIYNTRKRVEVNYIQDDYLYFGTNLFAKQSKKQLGISPPKYLGAA